MIKGKSESNESIVKFRLSQEVEFMIVHIIFDYCYELWTIFISILILMEQ